MFGTAAFGGWKEGFLWGFDEMGCLPVRAKDEVVVIRREAEQVVVFCSLISSCC